MGKPDYEHIHKLEVELGFAEDDPAPLPINEHKAQVLKEVFFPSKNEGWKENGGVLDLSYTEVSKSLYGENVVIRSRSMGMMSSAAGLPPWMPSPPPAPLPIKEQR